MRIALALAGVMLAIASGHPGSAMAQVPSMEAAGKAAKPIPSDLVKRKGWHVHPTRMSFSDLVKKLEEAVKKNKMGLVTAASASDNLKAKGITIRGNRVVGVFRPDFARRMLAASVAAGIEAPIRFYVTENADSTASLSYRTPSAVFAPYMTRRNPDLRAMAKELDAIFAQIALDTLGG